MQNQHEIYKETSRHLTIEVKNGAVENLEEATEQGTAVRVIKEGCLGFAYSTAAGALDGDIIKAAESVAITAMPDEDMAFPGKAPLREYKSNAPLFAAISKQAKIDLAVLLESSVLAFDKRIKSVRKSVYQEHIKEVHIVNSNGVDISFSSGLGLLYVTAVAISGSESEWAAEEEFVADPKLLDPKVLADAAASRALASLGGRKIGSCKCPCVLDRRVVAQLLEFIAPAFYADAIHKKRSPLCAISSNIYSSCITLADDVLVSHNAAPCDAEGSPTQKNVLVKEGILNSFISDTYYAKKLKMASTAGSVRASGVAAPRIGIHNLHILPGARQFDELCGEMNKGFFVTSVMGLHTANPVTGDFSIGAAGFWIDGGKQQHPVKGIVIAGNLHQILSRAASVGSDLKFWYTTGAPSLLIEEIAVGGD